MVYLFKVFNAVSQQLANLIYVAPSRLETRKNHSEPLRARKCVCCVLRVDRNSVETVQP